MGNFSDNLRKRFADKSRGSRKEIEFECNNCINSFNFSYEDILLNKSGDIEFIPEPACPRCGSTVDISFSDYGQGRVEDMLLKGEIRKER